MRALAREPDHLPRARTAHPTGFRRPLASSETQARCDFKLDLMRSIGYSPRSVTAPFPVNGNLGSVDQHGWRLPLAGILTHGLSLRETPRDHSLRSRGCVTFGIATSRRDEPDRHDGVNHFRGPTLGYGRAVSTIPTPSPDLFSVVGKTVLVTGGSRGIGAMIAAGFVSCGAEVMIASRKTEAVEATTAVLSTRGRCTGFTADLSTEEGARRLAEEVAEHHAHLEVLVNNSGATWGAPLAEHDAASWARVLDLNVEGVFHTTKFLLPLLQARATAEEPSRVINVGSIDGIHVPPLETYSYSASKAAVHQLTRHLAKRLAPTITVNALAPGPFESKMMAATLEAFGEQIAASAPLQRIGRPDDMAGAAVFLASRAASYITGAILPVDGGIATTC